MPYLQLQDKPYMSLDDSAKRGIAAFYDAAKDDAMGNERRPGLASFVDLGTGVAVDTVYEWESAGLSIAVSAGRIFKVTSAGVVTEITGVSLNTGYPVYAADFGATLYLANGGRIVKTDGLTSSFIADADAPTAVTHIGYIDQYLIAISNNLIYVAEVANPDDWQGTFFDAEASKDRILSLMVGWREVVAFGSKTIEYFATSGVADDPFSRLEGTQTEKGIIAAHSPQMIDNTWFFVDHERRAVRMEGRTPRVISTPIDRQMQAIPNADNVRGFRVQPDGEDYYVLQSPSQTWAYDVKRDVWAQWSYWNNATGTREAYLGQTACYMRAWNKHLVGSRVDGKIYTASKITYQDGGNPIVTEIWSGWENSGSDEWKTCSELRLKLRRGDGLPLVPAEPLLEVSYRDNGGTVWSNPRTVNLGQLGESEQIARLRVLGRYRTRQWRFRIVANVPLALVSAEVL